MTSIPADKLDRMVERWQSVQDELNKGAANQQAFAKLSKEFSDLSPVVAAIEELRKTEQEQADLAAMIADAGADREMRAMAEDELDAIKPRLADMEHKLQLLLLPKDAADDGSAILEVRAGTGGDEAALFVRDLYEMYRRWGAELGWDFEVMDASPTELGGFKELILGLSGDAVFRKLCHESGGHRVQRVPDTETKGRIHTSAATVAVLPEPEDVEVNISSDDYRKDLFCASGPGGQHVNKTASAVRLTHLATNIVVQCQDEKSQHKNLAKALRVLKTRIYEHQRRIEHEKRATERRELVGSGDRSQRIRTYNFPQNRVTDHRINESFTLDQVMAGRMGLVVDAIERHAREKRKSEMEQSAKPAAT